MIKTLATMANRKELTIEEIKNVWFIIIMR